MSRITDNRRRVLVVTADGDTAASLRQALQAAGDLVWCGWATDIASARHLPAALEPDLIVTDVAVPGRDGRDVVAALAAASPHTPLVVWTHTRARDVLLASLRCGIHGYVLADDGLTALVDALRAASRGRMSCSAGAIEMMAAALGRPDAPATPLGRPTRTIVESASLQAAATLTDADTPLHADDVVAELTTRELEVMERLGRGLDNGTIGCQLGISVTTVTAHVRRVRAKLGARSRGELIAMSARLGEGSAAAS